MRGQTVAIERVDVRAYTVPTQEPESDGTLEWDATTVVVVEAHGGGHTGLGYAYAHTAAATLIRQKLADVVQGADALAVEQRWADLYRAVRNIGRKGLASYAIAAVDIALWDLKARLLDVSAATLLGRLRADVPIYGSGGFTSYSPQRLCEQLAGWAHKGIPRAKMKVGRDPDEDPQRVQQARSAIGRDTHLYVDANGAYTRQQALAMAERFAEHDVSWFEEPVSSDDLAGLRLLRDRSPASSASSSPLARSTACKPTSPAAGASPASGGRQRSVTQRSLICRRIPHHTSAPTPALPHRPCATWSGSTITCAWRSCCSTARSNRATAASRQIPTGQDWAWR